MIEQVQKEDRELITVDRLEYVAGLVNILFPVFLALVGIIGIFTERLSENLALTLIFGGATGTGLQVKRK